MDEVYIRPTTSSKYYLKKVKELLKQELPFDELGIKDVQLMGAQIVIYLTNPRKMADYYDKIGELAKKLKKRIKIRTPPVQEGNYNLTEDGEYIDRMSPEEAGKVIKEILPEDCNVVDIKFNHNEGHALVIARKPGKVMGKNHINRKIILKETGWIIDAARFPPITSLMIGKIRDLYISDEMTRYREKLLKEIAQKINKGSRWLLEKDGKTWVRVTSLGGYGEVGRNCHLLTTKDSKILIDCGISLSLQGKDVFPNFMVPEFEGSLKELNAIVITHAHLDHIGALIQIIKGLGDVPIYCTEPTRDLMYLILEDFSKLSYGKIINRGSVKPEEILKRCITLGYKETTDISPDVRLTFFNAGHILGSAMAHFHIGEGYFNIAFTGDFRYDIRYNPKSAGIRLLDPASTEFPRLESLVMETTYGGKSDRHSYEMAVKELGEVIRRTISKGGKVLIPAFVAGRSQEVMLAIKYLMDKKELPPDLKVYVDGTIWEATAIHTAYPEYLGKDLRNEIYEHGPKVFPQDNFINIPSNKERKQELLSDEVLSEESCVIISPSGMLNGGSALDYFAFLAEKDKNAVVLVGYQAEGTIGRKIQEGVKKIKVTTPRISKVVTVNMDVVTLDGFSGHANRTQLEQYLRDLTSKREGIKIRRLILHHGEWQKTLDFMSWIERNLVRRGRKIKEVVAPQNLETTRVA